MEKNQCFYFGCWGSKGHFLWNAHGRHASNEEHDSIPFSWYRLDGKFMAEGNKQIQGKATLTIIDEHTVLSFPDRSVDSRGGCHSTFVAGGVFDFDQMVELSKAAFGQVWKRYEFEVTNNTP